jgi:anti-sigma regulatory factor (Ser/Thr protein kinase)
MTQLSLDPPRVGASPASTQPGSGRQPAVGVLKAHNYFRHEAFLFRGEDEFLAGTVPFIRDALRAGQTVMVAVISTHLRLLRSAMGSDAGLVHYLDMAKIGHNPARIIPAWRDFVAEHAAEGQPVCGIGEPIWASRRPAEVNECQLHEALLNFAIEPHTPVRLLCPYDVEALTPDIITEAQRTHPVMLESQDHQRSTLYSGWRHVETLFETALPTFEGVASHRAFGRQDLRALREDVTNHALRADLSPARSADLGLGVYEVAANSVKHGSVERVLRVWAEPDSLVCEIHDHGRITDPMIGRTRPARDHEKGRGLWIANHLCDLVQLRSGPGGTTVRVHTWL